MSWARVSSGASCSPGGVSLAPGQHVDLGSSSIFSCWTGSLLLWETSWLGWQLAPLGPRPPDLEVELAYASGSCARPWGGSCGSGGLACLWKPLSWPPDLERCSQLLFLKLAVTTAALKGFGLAAWVLGVEVAWTALPGAWCRRCWGCWECWAEPNGRRLLASWPTGTAFMACVCSGGWKRKLPYTVHAPNAFHGQDSRARDQ